MSPGSTTLGSRPWAHNPGLTAWAHGPDSRLWAHGNGLTGSGSWPRLTALGSRSWAHGPAHVSWHLSRGTFLQSQSLPRPDQWHALVLLRGAAVLRAADVAAAFLAGGAEPRGRFAGDSQRRAAQSHVRAVSTHATRTRDLRPVRRSVPSGLCRSHLPTQSQATKKVVRGSELAACCRAWQSKNGCIGQHSAGQFFHGPWER